VETTKVECKKLKKLSILQHIKSSTMLHADTNANTHTNK